MAQLVRVTAFDAGQFANRFHDTENGLTCDWSAPAEEQIVALKRVLQFSRELRSLPIDVRT